MGEALLCIEFALEMDGETADDLRREQPVQQPSQSPLFEMFAQDGIVGASLSSCGLAPPATADTDESITTNATAHQPAEEMSGPLGAGQRIAGEVEPHVTRGTCFGLAGLHPVPQILVDDAQIRFVADHPFAFRIEARAARKTAVVVRDLDPFTTVEDPPPDIDLVVENAFAQLHVTRQGRRIPDAGIIFAALPCARGEDTLSVQDLADLFEAVSLAYRWKMRRTNAASSSQMIRWSVGRPDASRPSTSFT